MLAELVDAVVGVDTHRDTHQIEIALPTGAPIATCTITNDSRGYAQLLSWILDHAPGPRVAVSIEGTRSYGVGLTRAVTAAGLPVIECEQPAHKSPPRDPPLPQALHRPRALPRVEQQHARQQHHPDHYLTDIEASGRAAATR